MGASAALAAAFNTPIAAVLFSLEEVMGDMHAPVLGSIVLGSATSWIVLHLLLGDEPLFHVPAYQLVHPLEFAIYALLGVAGGLVSVGFVKFLLWQRKLFFSLPASTRWLQPAAGGLTVGILGWFFPEVLGVGYGFVGQALNGQLVIGAMALLVCLKIIATATCYSSGNAGGIFGPSLFMGAMMGGAVGGVAHHLLPDYTGSAGAYALVGMGAAFAGIVRVPLTSVIMIFEITRDYSIIVPLMISNLMSYWISSRLQEEPIYEALQHQEGIHLPSGAKAREDLMMVGNAFRPESQAPPPPRPSSRRWPRWSASAARGRLSTFPGPRHGDPEQPEAAHTAGAPQLAGDLIQGRSPHLHADESLDYAMRRIAERLKALLCSSRDNERELKGTVSVADILEAYGTAAAARRSGPLPRRRVPANACRAARCRLCLASSPESSTTVGAQRTARAALLPGRQRVVPANATTNRIRNTATHLHLAMFNTGCARPAPRTRQAGRAPIYLEEARREQPARVRQSGRRRSRW